MRQRETPLQRRYSALVAWMPLWAPATLLILLIVAVVTVGGGAL